MLEFKACLLVLQIYKTVHYPFHLNLTILHSERRYNGVTQGGVTFPYDNTYNRIYIFFQISAEMYVVIVLQCRNNEFPRVEGKIVFNYKL